MKTLIIGPSWIGDMVMSQSLYMTLKKQHPNAQIDVMAPAWCKDLLARMPEVDNVVKMPLGHGDLALGTRYQLGLSLKKEAYTHAYILPNSAKSALIPWVARIPHRIGWKGEMRYGLLNDLRPDKRVFELMVERYCALAYPKQQMTGSGSIEDIPYPKLTVNSEDQQRLLTTLNISKEREIVGMCPGAEFGPAKRWPEQHYAQLAAHLIEQGKQVWIFGSEKDLAVAESIKAGLDTTQAKHCHLLTGKTSITEAIDLLALCQTIVCNDSGLMHIAASVGCHIVAIYGSTSPTYTPPLTDKLTIVNTEISCRPCFKRECPYGHMKCLTEISALDVIKQMPKS